MAYSISYQRVGKMKYPRFKSRKKHYWGVLIAVIFLTAAFSVGKIRNFLLPGNPAVTEQALYMLVTDIQSGETPMDAITAFCQTILENGKQN